MRTALFVAAVVLLPILVYFLMSLLAAFSRIVRGGPNEAREFILTGLRFGSFVSGDMDRPDSSSLVPTRAGIGIKANKNGTFTIRPTRTISKDVF